MPYTHTYIYSIYGERPIRETPGSSDLHVASWGRKRVRSVDYRAYGVDLGLETQTAPPWDHDSRCRLRAAR